MNNKEKCIITQFPCQFLVRDGVIVNRDGVSLKTPRPRGWVRVRKAHPAVKVPVNKRNIVPISPCQSTVHTTSVAKPGIPGAIKIG